MANHMEKSMGIAGKLRLCSGLLRQGVRSKKQNAYSETKMNEDSSILRDWSDFVRCHGMS